MTRKKHTTPHAEGHLNKLGSRLYLILTHNDAVVIRGVFELNTKFPFTGFWSRAILTNKTPVCPISICIKCLHHLVPDQTWLLLFLGSSGWLLNAGGGLLGKRELLYVACTMRRKRPGIDHMCLFWFTNRLLRPRQRQTDTRASVCLCVYALVCAREGEGAHESGKRNISNRHETQE